MSSTGSSCVFQPSKLAVPDTFEISITIYLKIIANSGNNIWSILQNSLHCFWINAFGDGPSNGPSLLLCTDISDMETVVRQYADGHDVPAWMVCQRTYRSTHKCGLDLYR